MGEVIYLNKDHENECAGLKFLIYSVLTESLGHEKGLEEYEVWRDVTDLNALRRGGEAASRVILKRNKKES
jgi:hypothetical protein